MEQLTITDYLKSQIEIRQVKNFTEWINSQGEAQYCQVRDIISKYLANEMLVDQITNKVSCYILDQALGYAEYLRQQATLEEKMAKRSEYENYIDYRRAVVRESQKRRRMKAAEDGLCTICCLNIPDDGHRICKACRMRISERRRNGLGG